MPQSLPPALVPADAILVMAWARFTVSGFHRWPTPTRDRMYLGERHRHTFHIRVGVWVEHDDRAVEFHDLLSQARQGIGLLANGMSLDGLDFGGRSCEAIARDLLQYLAMIYGADRVVLVEVAEDGEAGATLTTTARPTPAAPSPPAVLADDTTGA